MSLLYIREVLVSCADLEASLEFYVEAFGFEVIEQTGDSAVLSAAGADAGRVRLTKAGHVSGNPDPKVWDAGARLFGVYSRDLEETTKSVRAAGGFAGPIVSYPYGERTMSEMVAYGRDGVWWTIPLALPGQHRPSGAYASDSSRVHSELHTAVLVVDDHDHALSFFKAAGLDVVFDGEMRGADIETMVGIPEGASLRLSFMSGPDHLPARLELMSFTGTPSGAEPQSSVGIQRLIYVCDDVETTTRALVDVGGTLLDDGCVRGPVGITLELVGEADL